MEFPILKKPPIIEAIFQIRWKVREKDQSPMDPLKEQFKFFPGRFAERIMVHFPSVEVLQNSTIPDEMEVNLPRFRFKKSSGYPLIQIGPAVLTVNFDRHFSRNKFFETCEKALQTLFSILPDIQIEQTHIHYIDGLDFDYISNNSLDFLAKSLHTHFNFDEDLFREAGISHQPIRFNFDVSFKKDNPPGIFSCQIRSGRRQPSGTPIILMDTIFQTIEDKLPNREGILDWIKEGDTIIHKWFFKMIENQMERFQ